MNEESSVDRMIREAREDAQADVTLSQEQTNFLGKALDHVVPKIMDAISDGLKRAMGTVEHGHGWIAPRVAPKAPCTVPM